MRRTLLILLALMGGMLLGMPAVALAQPGSNAQATKEGFKPRGDVVVYKNGRFAREFPCTDTDLSRGTAFVNALAYTVANASSTTYWRMELGPGTFEFAANINTPASGYFSLYGAGLNQTQLYLHTTDTPAAGIEGFHVRGHTFVQGVEFRCGVGDLEVYLVETNCTDNIVSKCKFSHDHSDSPFYVNVGAAVDMLDCYCNGRIANSGGTVLVKNSKVTNTSGHLYYDFNTANSVARFQNSWLVQSAASSDVFSIGTQAGSTVHSDNNVIDLSGAGYVCILASSIQSRTMTSTNDKILLGGSSHGFKTTGSGSSISVRNPTITGGTEQFSKVSGTLAISGFNYDTSLVSGTPTYLTTNALKASLGAASSGVDGYLSGTDFTTFNAKVSGTRSIATTSPLTGGGDLSADRTLGLISTNGNKGIYSPADGTSGAMTARAPVEADAPNTINWGGLVRLTGVSFKNVKWSNPAASQTDYSAAVPSGKRWLVSRMCIWGGASGGAVTFQVKISGSYYTISGSTSAGVNTLVSSVIQTPFILEAGETLSITPSATGMNVWAMVTEFDNTCGLYTKKLTAPASGNNTLWTAPAGTSVFILDQNMGFSFGGAGTVSGGLFYNNLSGAARTISANLVPSGGSVASGNQIFGGGASNASNGARTIANVCACMEAGDFLNVATDANTATQFFWANFAEKANP